MGCAGSKLDNEDAVRQCRERCRFMKEAVHARHHLAAAHYGYCRSLRLTGSALVSFAVGEPFSVSSHAPAAVIPRPSTAPQPPPRPRRPSPSPSVRPPSSSHHHHQKPPPPPPSRRKKPMKLPHILSDSSFTDNLPYNARANSTYSSTSSQASSILNWDHLYPPPSPPVSEYFNQKKKEDHNDKYVDFDDKASNFSSNSNDIGLSDDRASNHSSVKNHRVPGAKHGQNKGSNLRSWEAETEEVQCSEWGDHDTSISSQSNSSEEDNEGNFKLRSDFVPKSDYVSVKSVATASVMGGVKKKVQSKLSGKLEKLSSEEEDGNSCVSWGNETFEGVNSERRMVVRHKDLLEIVSALKEYFDDAASAGDQVSEMLESGRDQLDRSFKQMTKTIYHSSGILSNLSSRWTSKPPLTVKYRFEPSVGTKSLCSTLERLLAWEKKMYQEVKAREGLKIDHENKLSALQSQEYRDEDEAKLYKTKASIKRLQSLILVTSQAVSTTSSAIVSLRDSDLVPQLIELCHGFMYMSRSMHQSHEIQTDIVQQVRGLINHSSEFDSTSELHRQATLSLEFAVSAWHSSFSRLIKFHRDFICSLYGWFKLNLVTVNNEPTNAESKPLEEVFTFIEEWMLALDRVPDTVACEAIKSFDNIIRSISLKQAEELKIKKRTETASKELEKKSSSLRIIEKKYYQPYSMAGIDPPDVESYKTTHVFDTRDPLAEKKTKLVIYQRRVEDEMTKHSKAAEVTRAMTLNNIRTGLPGVFQAITSFYALISEALETACNCSYAI